MMENTVNDWVQEGLLYVWRYANPRRSLRGWHFTADPAGCRSIRNLLERMFGGEPCHRTLKLPPVTAAISSVPSFGQKVSGRFEKLRVEYLPEFEELQLLPKVEALIMTVGDHRLHDLATAFAEVEIGNGDFGIRTSDKPRADPWMFWWMPSINDHYGKRE